MPRQRTTRGNDGRWEYAYGLLESQRINCKGAKAPEVGEVVLVVGNGKNRGEWKKWKVLRQARGREGAVRGVVLLHKWQTTQRQILSVWKWMCEWRSNAYKYVPENNNIYKLKCQKHP